MPRKPTIEAWKNSDPPTSPLKDTDSSLKAALKDFDMVDLNGMVKCYYCYSNKWARRSYDKAVGGADFSLPKLRLRPLSLIAVFFSPTSYTFVLPSSHPKNII